MRAPYPPSCVCSFLHAFLPACVSSCVCSFLCALPYSCVCSFLRVLLPRLYDRLRPCARFHARERGLRCDCAGRPRPWRWRCEPSDASLSPGHDGPPKPHMESSDESGLCMGGPHRFRAVHGRTPRTLGCACRDVSDRMRAPEGEGHLGLCMQGHFGGQGCACRGVSGQACACRDISEGRAVHAGTFRDETVHGMAMRRPAVGVS